MNEVELTTSIDRQAALMTALLNHPENHNKSEQWALGYVTSMLFSAVDGCDEVNKMLHNAYIDILIAKAGKVR